MSFVPKRHFNFHRMILIISLVLCRLSIAHFDEEKIAEYNLPQSIETKPLLDTASIFSADVLTGSCDTLANTDDERLYNPCSKVVDYSFYIPSTSSKAALQLKAQQSLNSTVILASGLACSTRLVRLVCGELYLKCHDGVDFSNSSTYNFQIYRADANVEVGLPFDRPCLSTCSEARQYCSSALYSFVNNLPNCTARINYAAGTSPVGTVLVRRYDPTNTQCFVPTLPTLQVQEETFLYKNDKDIFCSGFADTIVVGSGTSINTSYAVLQEPGVVQNSIIDTLQQLVDNLPPFIPYDCMLSLRKYFCYQALLKPERITIRTAMTYSNLPQLITQLSVTNPAILNAYVALPRLPQREVCEEYAEVCADFIESVANPSLTPNCSATMRGRPGVVAFPTTNQTFLTERTLNGFDLKFPAYVNTELYYNASEFSYKVQCPRGYVIPTDPDHDGVRMVGFSACAVPCKINIWTEAEWKSLINFSHLVPMVSIVFAVGMLIFILVYREDFDKNYLLSLFTILSLMASITSTFINESNSADKHFCLSNAVPYRQEYGRSACTAQGVVLVYCTLACCATLFVMSIHISIYRYKRIIQHKAYYAAQAIFIVGLPIVPVAVISYYQNFGFAVSQPWCYVLTTASDPRQFDLALTALPIGITASLSVLVLAGHTILNNFFLSNDNKRYEEAEQSTSMNMNSSKVQSSRNSINDEEEMQKDVELVSKKKGMVRELSTVQAFSPRDEDGSAHVFDIEGQHDIDKISEGQHDVGKGADKSPSSTPPPMQTYAHSFSHSSTVNYANIQIKPLEVKKSERDCGNPSMLYYKLLLVVMTMLLYIPYVFNKSSSYLNLSSNRDAYSDYTECVFQNFLGDDDAVAEVCGSHPDKRPSSNLLLILCLIIMGNMIVMAPLMCCCLSCDRCVRNSKKQTKVFTAED